MTNPAATIITPAFNHERFLTDSIESVIAQTFDSWELIIVDDASTDSTSSIASMYSHEDDRIKCLRHESNYGIFNLSVTYNEALKISRGEYIAILEGDDYWPKDKLETQLSHFDKNGVVLSWGKGIAVDDSNNYIKQMSVKKYRKSRSMYDNSPVGASLPKLIRQNFIIPSVTVMVRKSALLDIGGFKQPPNVPNVDYPTWLELSLRGEFRYIDRVLGYWRRHSKQVSRLYKSQMTLGHARCSLDFYAKLRRDECECVRSINRGLLLSNLHWAQGKIELLEYEWEEARKQFFEMLKTPNRMVPRALVGLLLSLFHGRYVLSRWRTNE